MRDRRAQVRKCGSRVGSRRSLEPVVTAVGRRCGGPGTIGARTDERVLKHWHHGREAWSSLAGADSGGAGSWGGVAPRALPSGVFGPRDFAPFLRLASARALLTETAARGAAPIRDMAGFLAGWRVVAEAPGVRAGQRKFSRL
jgi:hypothetical protein